MTSLPLERAGAAVAADEGHILAARVELGRWAGALSGPAAGNLDSAVRCVRA
jgi:hypothetical protein